MSNILLTSIGTGKYNEKTKEIAYQNTKYVLYGKTLEFSMQKF